MLDISHRKVFIFIWRVSIQLDYYFLSLRWVVFCGQDTWIIGEIFHVCAPFVEHYIYSYVSKTRKPAIGQFNDVRIIMIPDDDWGSDEVVNLNALISEYLKSHEYEKLKSFHPGVEVECNLETDLLNIPGSPAHLSKTIMSLVSNAAEAMPDGGKLSISTENRYVGRPIKAYDHVEEGDYVILTVSDTGAGMSSEDMRRIFEPFFTKKVMGRSGTGLGMAVIWGTVKDHKGHIDIQSAEGEGTTFKLYFPITNQKPAKDEVKLPVVDCMGRGEPILVVDDAEDQRQIAYTILSELGYSVTTASSGEEAAEYLQNNSVALLLLDMIMDHGMDGLETYKEILKIHPNQKAIIISGLSETDRVKEAQKLGVRQFVEKPYTLDNLCIAVKNELNR